MKIIVLDFREKLNTESDFTNMSVYFATKMENIQKFMEKNKDFQPDRKNYTWWWTTHSEELDSPLDDDGMEVIRYDDMEVYDWDGNNLCGFQPCYGYESLYEDEEFLEELNKRK